MNDGNCTVRLDLPKKFQEQVNCIIPNMESADTSNWNTQPNDGSGIDMVSFEFDELDCSRLGFEIILQNNKIPYDKSWEDCDEYPDGTESFRIDRDGNTSEKGNNQIDIDKISFHTVENAANKGIEAVMKVLEQHRKMYLPISFEEQMEILEALNQ